MKHEAVNLPHKKFGKGKIKKKLLFTHTCDYNAKGTTFIKTLIKHIDVE